MRFDTALKVYLVKISLFLLFDSCVCKKSIVTHQLTWKRSVQKEKRNTLKKQQQRRKFFPCHLSFHSVTGCFAWPTTLPFHQHYGELSENPHDATSVRSTSSFPLHRSCETQLEMSLRNYPKSPLSLFLEFVTMLRYCKYKYHVIKYTRTCSSFAGW